MNALQSIDEQAADWVVRLEGTVPDDADRRALAEWTSRSPAHAASLLRARTAWTAMAHLRPEAPRPRPRTRRRLVQAAAAALLLTVGAVGWVQRRGDGTVHRTAKGEVRRIGLPDGSQVVLAAASALAPRFDGQMRRVDLLAGEALFAPAPVGSGESRPFTVFAGSGRVRALGTRFTVSTRQEGFDVAVLEHGVEVSLAGPGAPPPVLLQGAQGLHYDATVVGAPYPVDPVQQSAWTEGRLVFDRMALAEVVAVLNRYRSGRIVLASGTLAGRRVSGVFRAERAEDALRMVVAELGARRLDLPLGTTILF